MKNIYGYLIIAFPLLLIGAWLMTGMDGKDYQMRLENIVGHSLYNYWNLSEEIIQQKELKGEALTDAIGHLNDMVIHANVIDNATSQEILEPIAHQLIAIISGLKEKHGQTGEFTKEDKHLYQQVIADMEAMQEIMLKIFYKPNSKKGGEVLIEVKDVSELSTIHDRLVESSAMLAK
ncbi:hypothetical protein MKY41_06315 [Sporosarcina sp. FSL W7-1349]|uniref:hypothetical protein n=1 Tax=Sporosarcina sp. FSL W7-1349 TaxID=2921561 RepID=UPI0030F5D877